MIVFAHNQFVPEEQAVVSVFDRGFRYGDGLFETALVLNGKMFRWPEHLARLVRGAQFLSIALPHPPVALHAFATELIVCNQITEGVIRLQLSRGVGPRGYAPTGMEQPHIVMSMHPSPDRSDLCGVMWKLTLSSLRLSTIDPLAQHKTCSRLLQVLAADEARARGADEALLLNTDGCVVEGSTSNLFWIDRGTICTPPLGQGVLPGVTRATVLELCTALGVPCAERAIRPEQFTHMEGVFLSLTSRGVVEAMALDGITLRRSPLTTRLQDEFEALLARECA